MDRANTKKKVMAILNKGGQIRQNRADKSLKLYNSAGMTSEALIDAETFASLLYQRKIKLISNSSHPLSIFAVNRTYIYVKA